MSNEGKPSIGWKFNFHLKVCNNLLNESQQMTERELFEGVKRIILLRIKKMKRRKHSTI